LACYSAKDNFDIVLVQQVVPTWIVAASSKDNAAIMKPECDLGLIGDGERLSLAFKSC